MNTHSTRSRIEEFFAFARERHEIYLRRRSGQPWPWTDDEILREGKFTNVYRELDRTTQWFSGHVREPMRSCPEVLLATVVFRWFNRIITGEAIFQQLGTFSGGSAWEVFLESEDPEDLRHAITAWCGPGPYVTGAYIIKTPDGYSKLSGVLASVGWFCRGTPDLHGSAMGWRQVAETCLGRPGEIPLQDVWSWLREHPYLGDFMAYEIVTDLAHTDLLEGAPDIMTWANPGPGTMRGLNRLHDRPINRLAGRELYIREMQELLEVSRDGWQDLWPDGRDWPAWTMREVEHTLCEWDKYERVRLGQGKLKARYRMLV